ncbi:hypothetical protein Dimus_009124 [Dionaea muscipula]
MELLTPSHPPAPTGDWCPAALPSPPSYTSASEFRGEASSSSGGAVRCNNSSAAVVPEIVESVQERVVTVHVAVGKSVDKAIALIRWTIRRFGNGAEVCLVHVHQPSPLIPTLLGKLPASQANEEVVTAFRREEREKMKKLLLKYLGTCFKMKVKASVITIEANQVQKGLVDLVTQHGIRKLVVGAVPDNRMMAKSSSRKADYAAKNAPLFCEIWFINKGQHVWTRESRESATSGQASELKDLIQDSQVQDKEALAVLQPLCCSTDSFDPCCAQSELRNSLNSELERVDDLSVQLMEAKTGAMSSTQEAHAEILKRRKFEAEALQSINKVKILESAYAHEAKLRKEAEQALRTAVQEHDRRLEENFEVSGSVRKTMRNLAVLDSRVQEANRRCDEAAGEFQVIQTSMASLHQEKLKIHRQKMEGGHWLKRWRSNRQAEGVNQNAVTGVDDISEPIEFSVLDIQTATCNLSDSFKLGEGGYGSVYKGELLEKTVAIKMLLAYNILGPSQFQKEVQVLSKLRHPHLVTLIGACPEAWSLVYDFCPNGSLQYHVFQRNNYNCSPLTWKDRARIISETSSAILFLHSSHPEKIVHGGLKPENILLDSNLRCKVCDFGIFRLVSEEMLRCPSFRRYADPKGAFFPYTDPEFRRTGVLTPKSDVYSLGVVILQLLTGRPPEGLPADVRRAVLLGKLASILDPSAGNWPDSAVEKLVNLGLRFCEPNSRDRPELTPAIVLELQQVHASEERSIPSFFLCPILQDIMHDPVIAADGYTYEAEALQGWLINGRETSPMTNLRLDHLQLTPNHTLRRAIQEWLICK